MDKPLLTLNWLICHDIAVARNGKWIAIGTNQGIMVYNHDGNRVKELRDIYDPETSLHFQIYRRELGFYANEYLHTFTVPDLAPVSRFWLFSHPTKGLIFNRTWVVWSDAEFFVMAFPRKEKDVDPFDVARGSRFKFVGENLVFVLPPFRHIPAVLYDLEQRSVIRELPPEIFDIAPDQRYYVKWTHGSKRLIGSLEQENLEIIIEGRVHFHHWLDKAHILTLEHPAICAVHHLDSAKCVARYFSPFNSQHTPRFSFDTITCQSRDGWIQQNDPMTGELLRNIVHMPGPVYHIQAAGRYLVFQHEFQILVFDTDSATIVWQRPAACSYKSETRRQTAIANSLVAIASNGQTEIWDFLEDRIVAMCPHRALSMCFEPPYLFATIYGTTFHPKLIRFDIEQQLVVHGRSLASDALLYISETHGLLLVHGTKLIMLNTSTLSEQLSIQGPYSNYSNSKAVNRNMVAMGANDGIRIMSLETGDLMNILPTGYKSRPIAINNDGTLLIIERHIESNLLSFWNPDDSDGPVYTTHIDSPLITGAFANDNTVVTSHLDGTVNFWDITHITHGLV